MISMTFFLYSTINNNKLNKMTLRIFHKKKYLLKLKKKLTKDDHKCTYVYLLIGSHLNFKT